MKSDSVWSRHATISLPALGPHLWPQRPCELRYLVFASRGGDTGVEDKCVDTTVPRYIHKADQPIILIRCDMGKAARQDAREFFWLMAAPNFVSGKLSLFRPCTPRHKGVDFAARPAVCTALERLRQSGLGINRIHFCSLLKCRDCRPCLAVAVAAGEETIFFLLLTEV